MEFASLPFVWLFLPLCLAAYYGTYWLTRRQARGRYILPNCLLIVASLLFYAWGGFSALLLLAALVIVNFAAGQALEHVHRGRRSILTGAILVNVLLLVYFKYFNMLATMAEILTGAHSEQSVLTSLLKWEGTGALGLSQIALPLAISFLVFQSISYLVDVYQKKVRAESNLFYFLLYLSFFAQLTQGPILRYGDLGRQIRRREHSAARFADGIRRFCMGLAKKVLIANTVAETADTIWAMDTASLGTGLAWFGLLLYTLQIYYDFSGYSDMAVGIGKMFGFDVVENFNYPYTSLSIQEFWRRWHMSLSFWFRDYIYIPLGGNRKGLPRTLWNITVVFLVTGIWHGANLTFLLWGLLFALFSVIERLFLGKCLQKNPIKPLNWVYTIGVVMMGWVLFRAPNLYTAGLYFGQLFSFTSSAAGVTVLSLADLRLWVALLAGIVLCGFVQRPLNGIWQKCRQHTAVLGVEYAVQTLLFMLSILSIISGSYNPSIYGNF